jgi:hypothetical protein
MKNLNVRRFTGAFGLGALALFLVEYPLYLLRGTVPPGADTARW